MTDSLRDQLLGLGFKPAPKPERKPDHKHDRKPEARPEQRRTDAQRRGNTPPGKGDGTNPEQLFAAGYSACFIGAMRAVAAKQGIKLPEGLSIDAEVDLGPVGQAYGVAARLNIHLPGMDREAALKLIEAAHQVCPYSNATRGNIPVELTLA